MIRTSHCWRHRVLSSLIVCLMAFEFAVAGQTDSGLRILIVKGNDAETVISQVGQPITVRVVDDNDRPAPNATVVFTAPDGSPSGNFVDGSKSVIAFTNRQGLATTPQYRASSTAGSFQIEIRAEYMDRVASASITVTNVVGKKSSRRSYIIAAVAGGLLAAAFAGKSGAGDERSTSQTPGPVAPPTIVFAGSSVGGPR